MMFFHCVPGDMPHDLCLAYCTLLIQTDNWYVFWIPLTSFYIYLLYAHMCVWVQVCQSTQAQAKRSMGNLQESVLSFLYMDSRAWTQVDRHGSKRLYPFSHFDCSYSPKFCMLHSFFFLNFLPLLSILLSSLRIFGITSSLKLLYFPFLFSLFSDYCFYSIVIYEDSSVCLFLTIFIYHVWVYTCVCLCTCTMLHMHRVRG